MRNLQAKKQSLLLKDKEEERVGLGSEGHFDTDIYGGSRYDGGYVTSIAANDDVDVSF